MMKANLLGLAAVLLAGCSSYSPWTQIEQDAPLGSDMRQVTTWKRSETPSPLMVVGAPLYEESWKIDGRHVGTYDVAKSITKYLDRIGYIERQRKTNGHADGVPQRVAEHRFFIVSVKPTIVVMTPYSAGSIQGRTTHQIDGKLNDQTLNSYPLVNGYHVGSKVAKSSEYRWFSPDWKTGIRAARKEGAQWIIDEGDARIVIGPASSGIWRSVQRER